MRVAEILSKNRALELRSSEADSPGYAASKFTFRPVHYLGSKLRILPQIEGAIDRLDPTGGPVCDLFSGSATVARYLSRRRQVMAVDVQEYARVLAEAVLNGERTSSNYAFHEVFSQDPRNLAIRTAMEPLIAAENEAVERAERGEFELLCEILEARNMSNFERPETLPASIFTEAVRVAQERVQSLGLSGAETVCVRHFGGSYFSYAQAAELDVIASLARESRSPTLLAATLSTASHLVNSIGKQFAQPVRPRDKNGIPKQSVIKKVLFERSLPAFTLFMQYVRQYNEIAILRNDHIAIRTDFREALAAPPLKPSVVYADPPYTRDHYSRFYHSLETIALGDDPAITKSNLGGGVIDSRGGYRAGRHQSPFCIKSQAPGAFEDLFRGVSALQVPLVLSYSGYDPLLEARPRVMTLDAVIEIAKRHFQNVNLEYLSNLEHIKMNSVHLNKPNKGTTEIILLCC